MRLFIALNFPDEVKDALYGTASALMARSLAGNFSHRENMHLTLAFLGEVHPRRVPDIKNVMDSLEAKRFCAVISGFGKFRGGGECLYWRGMRPCPPLGAMQAQLVSGLRAAGFEVDDKAFKPHITLARRCVMEDDFSEREFAGLLPDIEAPVRRISLMRSDRVAGRLTYTEMYSVPLGE